MVAPPNEYNDPILDPYTESVVSVSIIVDVIALLPDVFNERDL